MSMKSSKSTGATGSPSAKVKKEEEEVEIEVVVKDGEEEHQDNVEEEPGKKTGVNEISLQDQETAANSNSSTAAASAAAAPNTTTAAPPPVQTKEPKPWAPTTMEADTIFLVGVLFSVFASALSFGGVFMSVQAYFLIPSSKVAQLNAGIAFAFLFLIFAHMKSLILLSSFYLPTPESRITATSRAVNLGIFDVILIIISLATFGPFMTSTEFLAATGILFNIPVGTLISAIISEVISVACLWAAYRFWTLEVNPGPVNTMKTESSQANEYLKWQVFLMAFNMSFVVGSILALVTIVATGNVSGFTPSVLQAAFALTLLYVVCSFVAFILLIVMLYPNSHVPISTFVTVIFSLELSAFVFGLMGMACFSSIMENGYFTTMLVLGWVICLIAFSLGVATYTTLLGNKNPCYLCAPTPGTADYATMYQAVELEKKKIELLELQLKRQKIEKQIARA